MSLSRKQDQLPRIPGHGERVGIFGGTFDPVHLGHLILAEAAMEELSLDRILFIPAGVSPHKRSTPPVASAEDRLRMLCLAIEGEPRFSVDHRELLRDGPSYTIDTVRSLIGEYPGVRFLCLIGADNVRDLGSWRESDVLKKLVDFAVFDRGEGGGCCTKEFPLVSRRIDISATEIRERLAKGLSVLYLLPSTVHDHIMTHRLYTPSRSNVQA